MLADSHTEKIQKFCDLFELNLQNLQHYNNAYLWRFNFSLLSLIFRQHGKIKPFVNSQRLLD